MSDPINDWRIDLRADPTRQAIYVAFFACLSVWSGCSQPSRGTISLFDQIPPKELAGPWRIVARLDGVRSFQGSGNESKVDGLKVENGVLLQTEEESFVRRAAGLHGGEEVLVHIAYAGGWEPEGSVDVALFGSGPGRGAREAIEHGTAELRLTAPDSGAYWLRIGHRLPPGTEIPLRLAIALAVDPGARERDVDRAKALLRWEIKGHNIVPEAGLRFKTFPLTVDGYTRQSILLVAGDTLGFELPQRTESTRLRFWSTRPSCRSVLTVEAMVRGDWQPAGSWELLEEESDRWRERELQGRVGKDWRRIRFVVSAEEKDASLAVAEPLLVPLPGVQPQKPNLVIVDLDTMRSDRLGCYGYTDRPTSARLDSVLQGKGFFVFRNAYSTAPRTLPATTSFLTSRYLPGALINRQGPLRQTATLPEIMRANGYYCLGITGGGHLASPGFLRGFHEYYTCSLAGKIESTFPKAEEWLKERRVDPHFLFLHTYECHTPYTRDTFCKDLPHGRLGNLVEGEMLLPREFVPRTELTEDESTYVQAAYDGGVRKACDSTADLFLLMEELGLWQNTVVVLLSDHGEEFWDHSNVYAGHSDLSVYGELLNVPFILHVPNRTGAGLQMIEPAVSTVDLVPTVADLFDIDFRSCDGTSLLPMLNGERVSRSVPILMSNWPSGGREDLRRVSVVAHGMKYVEPVNAELPSAGEMERIPYPMWDTELFMLQEDPTEKRNIAGERPDIVLEMAAILRDGLGSALSSEVVPRAKTKTQMLSPDVERQLQALGYVEEN